MYIIISNRILYIINNKLIILVTVPSQPQKIKALAFSSDSVLVSWLPPLYPNGIISHYTVYFREAGR